jgi:DNA-binding NtrC family response regulator
LDRAKILVADDEEDIRFAYAQILAEAGHEIDTAGTGTEALEKVRATAYDLVLLDLVMPPGGGVALLQEIHRVRSATLVVVFSGLPSVDQVLAAFRAGAFDFLPKPVEPRQLIEMAARAAELRGTAGSTPAVVEDGGARHGVLELRTRIGLDDPFRALLGSSTTMRRLVETLREVAQTDSTMLLTGESGTGKSLVARTVHGASPRMDGPFVEANCVVYSEGLLHSELFGHEKGAFTGAEQSKRGRFELARGGTLFLDEIGEISPVTQILLLRVLQSRTFERVGGEVTLDADVRLIAATNRNLPEAIENGTFRADLFYRLNVIPVHLPPLRDHLEDVPMLAQEFLRRCNERTGRAPGGFSPQAMDALGRYPWPGNVRELDNVVERVATLCEGDRVELDDLPPSIRSGTTVSPGRPAAGTLREMERERILEALREAGGNKKRAAARLGIHRSTLYAKLRSYGLTGDAERQAS